MRIAIVIPCHNAGPYLAQTLGSVLEQSRAPDEVVVVDDSSSDDSLAIACRFQAASAGRVKVYSENNRNAAKTRNQGASLVDADAIMFLDSDDVLAPDAIEALSDALERSPSGIAACPWRRLEYAEGTWFSRPTSCAPRKSGEDALSAWLIGWYYPPCAVLWSREAFDQVGGWDETAALNDDGDLMMRALAADTTLTETSSGTVYYRKLPQGQTSLSGQRFTYDGLAGRIVIIEKIAWMLEQQGRLNDYRRPLRRAFVMIAEDGSARFAGLAQLARAKSREYGPSPGSRVLARSMRIAGSKPKSGTVPAPPSPRDRVEEIRFGLDRSEQLMAGDYSSVPSEPFTRPDSPMVSVVIPVYNRAHLLKRTLKSVLTQSFTDFEVLVVDDFSTDDPASVISALGDSRLRYIRQPENRGVAAARNRGLREARAPYVAFLDDDDEWFPEKLARQIDVFRQSPPDTGMVYTGVETVSDGGRRTLQMPTAHGNLYRELLVYNILHAAPASALIRRNLIREVGFFDESLPAIEDYDYWLRISRRRNMECVRDPLVRYNDFRDSATGPDSERRRSLNICSNLEARARFYRKHGAQMRREGLAHLFLVDSARRHLVPEWNDQWGALRLALIALCLAPRSWGARNMLFKAMKPPKILRNPFKRHTGFDKAPAVRGRK